MKLNEQMQRDGVVVVRDAFTPEQIAQLREVCLAHLREHGVERKGGKHEPFPDRHLPEIDWVGTHPPVVRAVQQVAGGRPIVLTGSDLHMSQFLGWHKDLGEVPDGSFREDHFATDELAIYKVGIYLQDHARGRGLTVRPGSHHHRELASGEACYVPTHAGDVTMIDVRLSHVGLEPDWFERQTLRLGALLGRGGRPSAFARRLREWYWRIRGEPEKIAIFLTFGVANQFTEDFKRLWDSSRISPDY